MDSYGNWQKLKAVKKEVGVYKVYNFHIRTNHNYFVGQMQLLVHNYKYIGAGKR